MTDRERANYLQRRKDAARREKINRLKMSPCADCHVQYSPWVMDFDHRNPNDKLFCIGGHITIAWDKIQDEIQKCDLVCSNCHRERTHKQRKSGLINLNRAGV